MSVDLTLNQKRPEVVSLKKIKDYHSLFDMQITTSLETTFFLSKHHMKIELNLLCLRLTFPQTESLICKRNLKLNAIALELCYKLKCQKISDASRKNHFLTYEAEIDM